MHKTAVQIDVENGPDGEAEFDYLVTPPTVRPHHIESPESLPKDFFIERNGTRYAGTHLIIDLWEADRLDDIDFIEQAMRDCVDAAGATLLHIHLHHFTPNLGVSGVAVLAESHISVHTWPETGFAAFDVFMCGDTEPQKAVDVLKSAFRPSRIEVGEHLRGRME